MRIFSKKLRDKIDEYNLKCNLLRCIITDGGKNICRAEKTKRFSWTNYKVCENVRCLRPIVIHPIIH